ncbi:MAG: GGDEF domain-containing protein, partial [Stellaceae bacterium]
MPILPTDLPLSPAAGALEAAGDAAYAWHLDSDRLDWVGRLAAVGETLATECATGRAFAGRIHPDDSTQRQHRLANHLDAAAPFDCEYRLRLADGSSVWLHERGQVERAGDGRPRRMLGVIRMVDDRKAQQTRLEQRVSYDELTGHFNATRLREAVDRILADGQRRQQAAAFLSVGVDGMAAINGRFGPAIADLVLAEIGRRLDGCVRVSDQIGRLGGDRFGVVLSHCAGEHVPVAARKILSRVNSAPVMTAAGLIAATVSIGSLSFPEQGTTSYEIMTRAEAALAEARRDGRGGHVHYAGEAVQRDRKRGLAIVETVQRAL